VVCEAQTSYLRYLNQVSRAPESQQKQTCTAMTDSDKTPYYWVKCADRAIPVSTGHFERLLELMPVLGYLLFGHPKMQPKTIAQHQDGAPVLEIPLELEVSASSFSLVLESALGLVPEFCTTNLTVRSEILQCHASKLRFDLVVGGHTPYSVKVTV
jgi:predicted RNA methylase